MRKKLKYLSAAIIITATSVVAAAAPSIGTPSIGTQKFSRIVTTIGLKKGSAGATGGYVEFNMIDNRVDLVYGGSLQYNQLDKDVSVGIVKSTVGLIIDGNYYLRGGIGALNSRYMKKIDKKSIISAIAIAGLNVMDFVDINAYDRNSANYGVSANVLLHMTNTKLGMFRFKFYEDYDKIDKKSYNRFGLLAEILF